MGPDLLAFLQHFVRKHKLVQTRCPRIMVPGFDCLNKSSFKNSRSASEVKVSERHLQFQTLVLLLEGKGVRGI